MHHNQDPCYCPGGQDTPGCILHVLACPGHYVDGVGPDYDTPGSFEWPAGGSPTHDIPRNGSIFFCRSQFKCSSVTSRPFDKPVLIGVFFFLFRFLFRRSQLSRWFSSLVWPFHADSPTPRLTNMAVVDSLTFDTPPTQGQPGPMCVFLVAVAVVFHDLNISNTSNQEHFLFRTATETVKKDKRRLEDEIRERKMARHFATGASSLN